MRKKTRINTITKILKVSNIVLWIIILIATTLQTRYPLILHETLTNLWGLTIIINIAYFISKHIELRGATNEKEDK